MKKAHIRPPTVVIILCLAAFSLPSSMIFHSCMSAIEEQDVLQVKDAQGPTITILSPQDGSSYAATVLVDGVVIDDGNVVSIYYEVLATSIGGYVPLDNNNSFTFDFPTSGLSGSITIKITAEDWNGNNSQILLNLVDHGPFPSFSAEPGNHQITLRWDTVPFADRYTIYYTSDGTIPSEIYGEVIDDVKSPYTIGGLKNGTLCTLFLRAHSTEGADNFSNIIKAIPLSSLTLAPVITEEYKQIRIEWNTIPGTNEFNVWKSENIEGKFTNVSGTIKGNCFIDTNVEDDTYYYYKVMPAREGSILSSANFGQTCAFPPASDRLVGFCGTRGSAREVVVSGDYAYVAAQFRGLQIVDISDPENPLVISSYTEGIDGGSYSVAVKDNLAFITDYNDGVTILDVSDPSNPVYIGFYDAGGGCQDVAVWGNYAYVACGSGFHMVDISTPSSPDFKWSDNGAWAYDVSVDGTHACVAYQTALRIIDISNPLSPEIKTSSYLPDSGSAGFIWDLFVDNTYVYLATESGGLIIVNISNPVAPWDEGFYSFATVAADVTVDGDYAHVLLKQGGFYTLDISDPSSPSYFGNYSFPDEATGICSAGNLAYIASGGVGLKIVDLSRPLTPSIFKDFWDFTGGVRGIAKQGDRMYITTSGYLYAVDVSNPLMPDVAGSFQSPEVTSINHVSVSGNYAFISAGMSELHIIDFTNLDAPVHLGSYDTEDSIWSIDIQGEYAFIANSISGLHIVDVSAPESPTYAGSYVSPHQSLDVKVADELAYIADGMSGLHVVDVADPRSPQFFYSKELAGPEHAFQLCVIDGYAFITGGDSGFHILEPVSAFYDAYPNFFPYNASDINANAEYVYVTNYDSGFYIIDVSNEESPFVVSTLGTGWAYEVIVSGRYAYILDGWYGLRIVDLLSGG